VAVFPQNSSGQRVVAPQPKRTLTTEVTEFTEKSRSIFSVVSVFSEVHFSFAGHQEIIGSCYRERSTM